VRLASTTSSLDRDEKFFATVNTYNLDRSLARATSYLSGFLTAHELSPDT
jgi:hypothetical protein